MEPPQAYEDIRVSLRTLLHPPIHPRGELDVIQNREYDRVRHEPMSTKPRSETSDLSDCVMVALIFSCGRGVGKVPFKLLDPHQDYESVEVDEEERKSDDEEGF